MKVKELLPLLQNSDPESEIGFWIDDGCCADFIELEVHDAYDNDPYAGGIKKPDAIYTIVRFDCLPGYRSCLQSGGTKRADAAWLDKYRKDTAPKPPTDSETIKEE